MKILRFAVFIFTCIGLSATEAPSRRYSTTEIKAAIRSGKVGPEYAERTKKMEEFPVREIVGEKLPYQLFTFEDYRGGYTLLVEADETFVILCSAVGGGFADDFRMTKDKERITLTYRYTSGSGRRFEHQAKYVIGSGKPEETAAVRDVTR
jgi:hypothetical protein